jgi:hypothetical protein
MSNVLLLPVKLLGWTAIGLALGVGWKLGSHLVGVAMGEENLLWFPETGPSEKPNQPSLKVVPQDPESSPGQ